MSGRYGFFGLLRWRLPGDKALAEGLGGSGEFFFRDAMGAEYGDRLFPDHPAEFCRLADGGLEFCERQLMRAAFVVRRFLASDTGDPQAVLAMQGSATLAVCPMAQEYDVEPVLEHGWDAEPVERVQPDNQVGLGERCLLGDDIDVKIGIAVVERADLDIGQVTDRLQQGSADPRALGIGVGVDDQDHRQSIAHNGRLFYAGRQGQPDSKESAINFLAHALLAGREDADRVGGLLGDFVKGHLPAGLPPDLAAGVALHRAIDSFADRHPAFVRSRQRISASRRRVSGVLVDLFYDHLLARDWTDFGPGTLDVYAAGLYASLAMHDGAFSERAQETSRLMRQHDWLCAYRDLSAVATAIDRMAVFRMRRENSLAGGIEEFLADVDGFAADFRGFMPEAMDFAANWRVARNG